MSPSDHRAIAAPLYKRALVVFEQALGPDHPSVATVLNNLDGLYRATEREKEADALMRR